MSDPKSNPPPDLGQPEIEALASAILDGAAVDWSVAEKSVDADSAEQFRVLQALAGVHLRSLEIKTPTGPAPAEAESRGAPLGTWGRFALVERLGEGSFGTVYRAWDSQLQRDVALKLAPVPQFSAPSSALAEARLLARVRHPHVLTVHDADVVDEQVGIWTEFIDGRTLDAVVREEGPLPGDRVLAIGQTLCGALAAVHAAHLLHRDIKAQNVMLEAGGRIVLMDFGASHDLARPVRPGDLTGTPLYLAPEILEGGQASAASDVYSLAVLLFYLLTGRHPVSGKTFKDVRTAHKEGRVERRLATDASVPAELARAIDSALSDDPSKRPQTADEFEAALRACELTVAAPHLSARSFWTKRRSWVLASTAVAILAVAIWAATDRKDAAARDLVDIRRLTLTGLSPTGAISRDGTVVAFLRRDDDGNTLWIRQIDSDKDIELTLPSRASNIRSISVEPDDRHVDVTQDGQGRLDTTVWRVSGGAAPELFIRNEEGGVAWSPDGRHVAFLQFDSGQDGAPATVAIARADGTVERRLPPLALPANYSTFGIAGLSSNHPAWSPDGRLVAALASKNGGSPSEIHVLDVESGRTVRTVRSDSVLVQVAWIDLNTLAVVRGDVEHFKVSTLDLRTQTFHLLTPDPASYENISVTGDGDSILATLTEPIVGGVWLGDPSGADAVPIVPETSATPADMSLDLQGDLAYSAKSDAGTSVWFRSTSGGSPRRLVTRGAEPTLSPDGHFMLYVGPCPTRGGLCRVNADGSNPVFLTSGAWARITPDSRTVVFASRTSQRPCHASPLPQPCGQTLWSLPLSGGAPGQINDWYLTTWPAISADGRRMMLLVRGNGANAVRSALTCDLPRCTNIQEHQLTLLTRPYANWGMTPDGRFLAYVTQDRPTNIWVEPIDGSAPPRQLTHFDDHRIIRRFTWSPDGSRLGLIRTLVTSNIVLLRFR